MTDEVFTGTEDDMDNWVDVRMINPEEGEWNVDFVVVDGQVNYVDLRIRPEVLAGFVDCLIDDTDTDQAKRILTTIAERKNIDLSAQPEDE